MKKTTKVVNKTKALVLPPRSKSKPSDLRSVALAEKDAVVLRELEHAAVLAKLSLADIELQIMHLTQNKQAAAQAVLAAVETLRKQINESATAHGINVEDTTQAWSLDMKTMQFTRV